MGVMGLMGLMGLMGVGWMGVGWMGVGWMGVARSTSVSSSRSTSVSSTLHSSRHPKPLQFTLHSPGTRSRCSEATPSAPPPAALRPDTPALRPALKTHQSQSLVKSPLPAVPRQSNNGHPRRCLHPPSPTDITLQALERSRPEKRPSAHAHSAVHPSPTGYSAQPSPQCAHQPPCPACIKLPASPRRAAT